jgi:hypothetical protein
VVGLVAAHIEGLRTEVAVVAGVVVAGEGHEDAGQSAIDRALRERRDGEGFDMA